MKNFRTVISRITYIEVMILVAILGIISAIAIPLFLGMGGDPNTAQNAAKEWARQMGYTDAIVMCVGYDTDGDGYVSCTIKTKEGELIDRECAGPFSWNHGCRAVKPRGFGYR